MRTDQLTLTILLILSIIMSGNSIYSEDSQSGMSRLFVQTTKSSTNTIQREINSRNGIIQIEQEADLLLDGVSDVIIENQIFENRVVRISNSINITLKNLVFANLTRSPALAIDIVDSENITVVNITVQMFDTHPQSEVGAINILNSVNVDVLDIMIENIVTVAKTTFISIYHSLHIKLNQLYLSKLTIDGLLSGLVVNNGTDIQIGRMSIVDIVSQELVSFSISSSNHLQFEDTVILANITADQFIQVYGYQNYNFTITDLEWQVDGNFGRVKIFDLYDNENLMVYGNLLELDLTTQELILLNLDNNLNGSVQANEISNAQNVTGIEDLVAFTNNTNLQIWNNFHAGIRLPEFYLSYRINEVVDGVILEQSGSNPIYYRTELSRLDVLELAIYLVGLNGSYALYRENDQGGTSLLINQIWSEVVLTVHPLLFQNSEPGQYNYTFQVIDHQDNSFLFAIQIDASQLRSDVLNTTGLSITSSATNNEARGSIDRLNVLRIIGLAIVITAAIIGRQLYGLGRRGYIAELKRGIALVRWKWSKLRGFK